MILRKFFSVASSAEAIQRFTMPLSRQRQTRRVRKRTPAWGLSMILVVARQRCSEGGTSSRLMVIFLHSFHKAGGGGRVFSLQPVGQFLQTRHAGFGIQPPGRAHGRFHWVLLIFRKVVHHVAQFMSSTPLHRVLIAEYGMDRRAQRPSSHQ